jgi:hypothetical protein
MNAGKRKSARFPSFARLGTVRDAGKRDGRVTPLKIYLE